MRGRLVGTSIMVFLVWLSIRGIRPSILVQMLFIVIEYGAVISFVVLTLIHELSSPAAEVHGPSWSFFTIGGGLGGFKGLAEAAVVCGFLYAGWEAPLVLGEESTDARINPCRAAILGTAFLMIWYTVLMVVFRGVSSQPDLIAHGADVLAYAGQLLVPGFLGRALPLAGPGRGDRHDTDADDRAKPDSLCDGTRQADPGDVRPYPRAPPDTLVGHTR